MRLAVTSDNAVAHYHVGAELEDQGKYELALTHFRAALACDPAYADAYCNMGFIFHAQGKVNEAMEQYQAAIKMQPWHAQARTSLGRDPLDARPAGMKRWNNTPKRCASDRIWAQTHLKHGHRLVRIWQTGMTLSRNSRSLPTQSSTCNGALRGCPQ